MANGNNNATWYEFLLDNTLLKSFLSENNSDITVTKLICQFLHQSELILKEAETAPLDSDKRKSDNLRSKYLRTLALKTAAYLKWNLSVLEKGVPASLIHVLLNELLSISLPMDAPRVCHPDFDVESLRHEAVFALQLFHRWCLRLIVNNSFANRPSKTANVQISALFDPTIESTVNKDLTILKIHESLTASVALLKKLVPSISDILMPSIDCFYIPSYDGGAEVSTEPDWSKGTFLSSDQLVCQISYDLACYSFLHQDYSVAKTFFEKAQSLVLQFPSSSCIPEDVDQARLSGYLLACSSSLHSDSKTSSLFNKVEKSKQCKFKDLDKLLLEDNSVKELDSFYRDSLECEVLNTPLSGLDDPDILYKIQVCNFFHNILHGFNGSPTFFQSIKNNAQIKFFSESLLKTISVSDSQQKIQLQTFLRPLCHLFPKDLHSKSLTDAFLHLFSKEELDTMFNSRLSTSSDTASKSYLHFYNFRNPHGTLEIGSLEMELLETSDPATIKSLLCKLVNGIDLRQLRFLSDKWHVERDLFDALSQLPAKNNGLTSIYLLILVSKANVCINAKNYTTARRLLEAAEQCSVKETPFRVTRMIRWMTLSVDINLYNEMNCHQRLTAQLTSSLDYLSSPNISKRVKSLITSLKTEKDVYPPESVILLCVTFLVNTRDWSHLRSITSKKGILDFGKLVASLAEELSTPKLARKAARNLWEEVILIYKSFSQQKRPPSGTSNSGSGMLKEANQGMISQSDFSNFILKIIDLQIISAFISLLTRLYYLLSDNLNSDISSDFATIWPTALGSVSSNLIYTFAIMDSIIALLDHALTVNPLEPSWLKTRAELYFAQNQHEQALKFYLAAGSAVSDFFSAPVPITIYDDQIFRKMIKCSSYLNCHTQVVVLCQFLDEVDYTTAFKAIQEKGCCDAMNAYYKYIWDPTILEYLIYHHNKQCEEDKKNTALKCIGHRELNSYNPAEILAEAAKIRKNCFLRSLSKKYQ